VMRWDSMEQGGNKARCGGASTARIDASTRNLRRRRRRRRRKRDETFVTFARSLAIYGLSAWRCEIA
jgi:hypothetical protein